jgi:hypothetical protein
VTVRVTDNRTAPLSNSKSFTIAVVPPPRLSLATITNSVMNFAWSTYPGKTYRVVYKDDLNAPSWTPLDTDAIAAGYLLFGSDTNTPSHQRFYRVLQVN